MRQRIQPSTTRARANEIGKSDRAQATSLSMRHDDETSDYSLFSNDAPTAKSTTSSGKVEY